jgi:hypothetical protein
MGKKNKRGKNGPEDRKKRRDKKRNQETKDASKKVMKRARDMSLIVGLDGKTPIKSEIPSISYSAGGLKFDAPAKPNDMLTKAIVGAKQAVGQQAFSQAMQRTGNAVVAQTEAQTALAGIQDPFAMEPCAMAVFMYLSREVEYRDAVIEQLNERLVGLGAKPIDVEHPYPPTEPVPEEEAEEDELEAEETLPEEPEKSDDSPDE